MFLKESKSLTSLGLWDGVSHRFTQTRMSTHRQRRHSRYCGQPGILSAIQRRGRSMKCESAETYLGFFHSQSEPHSYMKFDPRTGTMWRGQFSKRFLYLRGQRINLKTWASMLSGSNTYWNLLDVFHYFPEVFFVCNGNTKMLKLLFQEQQQ